MLGLLNRQILGRLESVLHANAYVGIVGIGRGGGVPGPSSDRKSKFDGSGAVNEAIERREGDEWVQTNQAQGLVRVTGRKEREERQKRTRKEGRKENGLLRR